MFHPWSNDPHKLSHNCACSDVQPLGQRRLALHVPYVAAPAGRHEERVRGPAAGGAVLPAGGGEFLHDSHAGESNEHERC